MSKPKLKEIMESAQILTTGIRKMKGLRAMGFDLERLARTEVYLHDAARLDSTVEKMERELTEARRLLAVRTAELYSCAEELKRHAWKKFDKPRRKALGLKKDHG